MTHGHDKEARVDLQDKVAIITGALSDIGVATARRFIAEGAMLILSDSDPDALENSDRSPPGPKIEQFLSGLKVVGRPRS